MYYTLYTLWEGAKMQALGTSVKMIHNKNV